jgi:hypothetical protein
MGGVYNTVNLHLYHYAGNNPVKYTDPDGRFPVLVAAIGIGLSASLVFGLVARYTKPGARLFVALIAINPFFAVCRELYVKGLFGDNSPYIRGSDSRIAAKMSSDATANMIIANNVKNNFAEGSGKGSIESWDSADLNLAVGKATFEWTIDSYDSETGTAAINVTITDDFTFEEGERGGLKEYLTGIGRTAGLQEYDEEITYQIKVTINE